MRSYLYQLLGREISRVSAYMGRVQQAEPLDHDDGSLRASVVEPRLASAEAPTLTLINGNLNYSLDCESLLRELDARSMQRRDRVAIIVYNSHLRPLYRLLNRFSLRRGPYPKSFLAPADLRNLARLTGFEVTKQKNVGFVPWRLGGLGNYLNRVLAEIPLIRSFALCSVSWLRPVQPTAAPSSLSIVIPARNEAGNIERFFKELPALNVSQLELIFVEGNSSDETWQAILDAAERHGEQYQIKTLQQPGKGKFDAVRHGFAAATMDLLTIVDADLTMPPALLPRFVDAYNAGHADFINGNRLLYPMEITAMQPLNYLGNRFFARFVGYILGVPIEDSLCGTKLLHRNDYQRQCAWREDFGDFDPFGDFELLFSASNLELGVIDVPIRYRSRTYGTTQINRFRDGFELLRMCFIGFFRIKLR